ncbi:type 1 glutamine amidotransferase domain-containing protein [Planosporangium sp. 12N6]|uniref:type 1 glutamine amidotransferase domain-containing protein n=1 Tax=Planosporangium spinosum TaxID=3402278 RepID=UPI003CF56A36
MTKKILVLLSEYGYWGEELVGPLTAFDERGYEVVFATPNGRRPRALPPSLEPDFIDPPLGRSVVSQEVAKLAREVDGSDRLAGPISLADWLPTRPYTSADDYLRTLEAYSRAVGEKLEAEIAEYDALLVVGGSGPIVDLANNGRVHDLILAFLRSDKVIGAECYGVACLAFARDWEYRRSILWGRHVTGHCKEYDYKDGTGFLNTDFNMGPPPYPLEYILRDATGPDGAYHGNFGREISVIVDYPFVTGRSTLDSFRTGEKMVAMLEDGLRRYGW